MNVLDENITDHELRLLSAWGVRYRSVARDLGLTGIADEAILPLLHRLKRPTFFTRDADFFGRQLVHPGYSIVFLDVVESRTAVFIRHFLRHPEFRFARQRLGRVFKLPPRQLGYWQKGGSRWHEASWIRLL